MMGELKTDEFSVNEERVFSQNYHDNTSNTQHTTPNIQQTPDGMVRSLHPGVYGPLPTFFDDDQDIDYASYKQHLLSKYPENTQIFFSVTDQ